MYKLIDLIDIISSNYKIQISVNGTYVETFDSVDDLPYRYLQLPVSRHVGFLKGIYPETICNKNNGGKSVNIFKPTSVTRIDLIHKK